MPIIMVYGIPSGTGEDRLQEIHHAGVDAVVSVEELRLTDQQVTLFFPSDMMFHVRGEEIIVFVKGLFAKPERTKEVRAKLCGVLGGTIRKFFPDALVEVIPDPPLDKNDGFWSSNTAKEDRLRAMDVNQYFSPENFVEKGIDPKGNGGVRTRLLRGCKKRRIFTVAQLVEVGRIEFMKVKDVGKSCCDVVDRMFSADGLGNF